MVVVSPRIIDRFPERQSPTPLPLDRVASSERILCGNVKKGENASVLASPLATYRHPLAICR